MSSKFTMKLIRGGDDVDTMHDATDDCIEEPVFSRPSYLDIVNEVKVQYVTRKDYTTGQIVSP